MNKSDFLTSAKPKADEVEIDGKKYVINSLSVGQRSKFYEASKESLFKAQVLVVCMGLPFFDEDNESDIDEVTDLDSDVIADVANAVLKLSGLVDDEEEGDAEKNS